MAPDERAVRAHLQGGRFLAGVAAAQWRLISLTWPHAVIAVSAAERENAPEEFAVRFELTGYSHTAPTGGLWDVDLNASLPTARRPKGERVAMLFRADGWLGGATAMYAPWDRMGLQAHPEWAKKYPLEAWNPTRDLSFILTQLLRRALWRELVTELCRRGRGEREAGAFLLGPRRSDHRTVTRVIYVDDLDPECLTGGISFDGLAYSKLWDICDAENLVVIGDVHTHLGRGVRQSSMDADNPMLASDGHVALIVPDLASRPIDAHEVGVHRYDANGWTTWTGSAAARRLFIRRLL